MIRKLEILIAVLFLTGGYSFSQVLKFRVIDAGYGQNGEYKPGKSSNEIIIIDLDKNKLTIFGNKSQEHTIISTKPNEERNGVNHSIFTCLDETGAQCLFDYLTYFREGKKRYAVTVSYTKDSTPDPDNFWMYVMVPL